MRVFFNFAESPDSILDQHGVEVADLGDAYKEAEQAISEMLQENADLRTNACEWRLDV